MNNKDMIQFALTVSNGAVMGAIDEMGDVPTTFPTSNGGCHPLWVLGHLAFVEGTIPQILFGENNAAAEWQQLFGENSEPVADVRAYPSFAEVREKYLQLRERNLRILESLSEEDLDNATKAPPKGREREFSTFGKSFLTLSLHQTMHRGHVADARRMAGRTVLAGRAS
jgi:uncharacterized damage-inducible protein DinB